MAPIEYLKQSSVNQFQLAVTEGLVSIGEFFPKNFKKRSL